MRLASPWTPRLEDGPGLLYERLAAALAQDIATGVIPAGARLPAHRDLALRLGVGIGTVTKAYAEVERRGLAHSVHGRGTFATADKAMPGDLIDLAVNVPPLVAGDRVMSAALMGLSKRLDAATFRAYAPVVGRPEHRAALARWLADHRLQVGADRLVLCNGAQHGLFVAFSILCRPGSMIFTEAVTYPGMISLARHSNCHLIGVAMDDEGLLPDALHTAFARTPVASRMLYVTPSFHNPTGRTMGLERRHELVRLCRTHDVMIVEDDVYSALAEQTPPPLAELAPERTFYVNGLSKTVSPGLRMGVLVSPAGFAAKTASVLQASSSTVSPLSCVLVEQWLADGTAAFIISAVKRETAKRFAAARTLLGDRIIPSGPPRFHVWLSMPLGDAEILSQRAAARGIMVTSPQAPLVDADFASGIRLCLGGPTPDQLHVALTTVRDLLQLSGSLFPATNVV